MNIHTFKKNLLYVLLAGAIFITLPTQAVESPNIYFVSGFVTTQGVVVGPELNSNSLVTKITGKLGGASMGEPFDFTATSLGGGSFLAQADVGVHKKGVFFEIDSNGKIKTTAARYCLNTECRNRDLALTDTTYFVATDNNAGGYGIFDLAVAVLPLPGSAPSPQFVPGFVTTQPTLIPGLYTGGMVTKITGKLGGASMGEPFDFTATSLGGGSFLAQADVGVHKKGVFFEIDSDGKIKTTAARYCLNTECRNRDLALTDTTYFIATNNAVIGYGIFDLAVTVLPSLGLASFLQFAPGFITTQPTLIPGLYTSIAKGDIIAKITGKFGDSWSNKTIAGFIAIKLSNNSFLAKTTDGNLQKGVFFEIDSDGKIKVTAARSCSLTHCQDRNLALTDDYVPVATSQEADGYGIFDLAITLFPLPSSVSSPKFIPDFVTTQPTLIPGLYAPMAKDGMIAKITGKFGASWVGTVTEFTAIKLSNNSFLAKITDDNFQKGVFFEIDSDGQIKAIAARYCPLTHCRNRNLTLTDNYAPVATSQEAEGYGIFDLTITVFSNLAFNKVATQSSTYVEGSLQAIAQRAVDGSTNGNLLSNSISSTNKENGAWWQVDLGETKLVQRIHIFNQTDCCSDRLFRYRVSTSNDIDFATNTYREDFDPHSNSKQVIDLDPNGVQGRYVRVQLLGNNFLSLAEVRVLGLNTMPTININD